MASMLTLLANLEIGASTPITSRQLLVNYSSVLRQVQGVSKQFEYKNGRATRLEDRETRKAETSRRRTARLLLLRNVPLGGHIVLTIPGTKTGHSQVSALCRAVAPILYHRKWLGNGTVKLTRVE